MNKYICYVYYNESWEPYYVGKGSERGRIFTGHDVPIPGAKMTQVFYFETDWQAIECEQELINFWGRECDGGCLMNKTLGGYGLRGFNHSEETKRKMSQRQKGKKLTTATRQKISATRIARGYDNAKLNASKRKPITVRHRETGEVRSFISHREMGRQLNIDRSNLLRQGCSKGWQVV